MNRIKIVVLGRHNAGKTTFLEALCDDVVKIEHRGTTIALDYARLQIDSRDVYLFTTPGQERFEFIRQVVMQGLHGAILLVDATEGFGEYERRIVEELKSKKVPFVVAVNKQDLKRLEIDGTIPVVAKKGSGVRQVLERLIEIITYTQ